MTDVLTAIDDAVDLHQLLARVEARAARTGMCAYPNGGFASMARAVAAERRADRERQTGWRPRAYAGLPVEPAIHPSLKGSHKVTLPAEVNEPAPQSRIHEALSMTVENTPASRPTGPGLCRCSLCIVLGDIAPGHEPFVEEHAAVAGDEFVAEEPPRNRRGLFASLRALLDPGSLR